MKGRELVKKEAASKGTQALIAAAATLASAWLLTPWLLLVGIPATVALTYNWFRFRAVNGLKF